MIKLHLLQEIQYQTRREASNLTDCYRHVLDTMFTVPVGTEQCLAVSYTCEDSVQFKLECHAVKNPPTPQDKEAVDNIKAIPKVKNPAFCIETGTYEFEQLLILPQPAELTALLLRYCSAQSGLVYLRLLRENALEFIVQILVKSR